MSPLRTFMTCFILGCFGLIALPSQAQTQKKQVEHRLDLAGIQQVKLTHSVGNLTITHTTYQADEPVLLTATITGKKKGLLRRTTDISLADVKVSRSGNTLFIVFDEDGAQADLTLALPDLPQLDIDLAVGNLTLNLGATSATIDLGVGNADIYALSHTVGNIMMNAGVGDVSAEGALQQHTSRAIVAAKLTALGTGRHNLKLDVGVGNGRLVLTDTAKH